MAIIGLTTEWGYGVTEARLDQVQAGRGVGSKALKRLFCLVLEPLFASQLQRGKKTYL
jgi:hypothetical protein